MHKLQRGLKASFISHNWPEEKNIVYNPYGLNDIGRADTAFIDTTNKKDDLSFYLHDGDAKIRMLPLPIKDPNEYLPENMKQFSVHLADNFIFDPDNQTIGSGGSCEVRKVRSVYRQKEIYALKKLNMIYEETPEKFYKRCSKEFIIAKTLSHNIHITSTFFLLKVPTTTYTTRGWGFVMELGVFDLFQLIERSGWRNVPLPEKYCIFKQIAEAVKFCHDNGIAHRDLKPENVLLSRTGVCKLTDFGISDWYHTDPNDFSSPIKVTEGMIGSPPYTPPEVMYWDAKKHYPERLQKPYNPLKMDTYALGIILFTLVNNIIPFIDSCNTDPRFRDYENSYSNFINHKNPHFREKGCHKPGPGSEYKLAKGFKSTDASRVAWRLADPNPETRYTMEELFEDPWFMALETCVDPCETNIVKEPQLKRSTTNDGGFYLNEADGSKDDFDEQTIISQEQPHPTQPPLYIKKARSMLEIAESPNIPNDKTKKTSLPKLPNVEKTLSTLNENESEQEETVDSILDKPTPTDSLLDSPITTPVLNNDTKPKPIELPTKEMSKLGISRNGSINSNIRMVREIPSSSSLSGSSSLRSVELTNGATGKKRPIHHHLDVQSTISHAPSMRSLASR